MEFRSDIQALRGASVLFVVLFHLDIIGFQSGLLGVDAFFVISGYLMALLFDKTAPLDFYKRRFYRLFPPYAVTIAVTLFTASLITIPTDFHQVIEQTLFASSFTSNIGFWLQGSYFSKAEFNPLLHLWSLGVEAQFYLIVPILFPFLKHRRALTIILTALSLIACLVVALTSTKTAFFHMPLRLWEFLVGAIIAWNFAQIPGRRSTAHYIGLLAFVALICAYLTPMQPEATGFGHGHPGLSAILVCILTAIILVYGLPHRLCKSFPGNVLALVGRYSYSIYLVHFPIIVLINYSPFEGTQLGFTSLEGLSICLFLTAAGSWLMFHFVESKSHYLFNNVRTYLVAGILASLAAWGSIENKAAYSSGQLNIFLAWKDRSHYRCGKSFRITNPFKSICEITDIGDQASQNILLVGDSHADSLKESFGKIFDQNNIRVYFYVPNNPLLSAKYNETVIASDAKKLSTDAVVVHFNFNVYDDHFAEKITALSYQLRAQNTRLYIISPVPHFDSHIPKHLYKMTTSNLLEPIQMASDHLHKTANFWEAVHSNSFGQAIIIDPTPILCRPKCEIRNKIGQPYYFDSNHLTLQGAKRLNPLISELAKRIARKN